MRRAYRKRRVESPPKFLNFKPAGIPRRLLKSVVLSIDEYEAIRLADHLGKEHLEASEMMNISRPTFTRLIERARQKTAHAIIDGMELIIEGGNVDFCNIRYHCRKCGEEQILPLKQEIENCAECGSDDLDEVVK